MLETKLNYLAKRNRKIQASVQAARDSIDLTIYTVELHPTTGSCNTFSFVVIVRFMIVGQSFDIATHRGYGSTIADISLKKSSSLSTIDPIFLHWRSIISDLWSPRKQLSCQRDPPAFLHLETFPYRIRWNLCEWLLRCCLALEKCTVEPTVFSERSRTEVRLVSNASVQMFGRMESDLCS